MPPDAHGADDEHPQSSGGAPEPAWRPPAPPGTGAVQFSDIGQHGVPHSGAPASGAVPFADPPGAGAAPFSDYPELDAAPPPGSPGPGAAPFSSPSWPGAVPPGTPGPPGAVQPGAPVPFGPPAWQGERQPDGPQRPDGPRRTSGFAVTALVTGLFGLIPVAIGFGIAALVGRRSRIRKGKSLAIAGIAASIAWSLALNFLVPIAIESVFTAERGESGEITARGKALFSTLRKGDCFTGYDFTERIRMVEAVPCTEPHTGELIAQSTLPEGAFPGAERAELAAHVVCGGEAARLRKSPLFPTLRPYYAWPSAASWRMGDQKVGCAMHHDGDPLESRLAETVDTGLRTYEELGRGDCLKSWDAETHPLVSPMSCSEPHLIEVIATYEIKPGVKHDPGSYPAYPSADTLRDKVLGQCEKLIVRAFPRRPGPGIEPFAILPTPNDWESAIRTVVCGLASPDQELVGPLPRG